MIFGAAGFLWLLPLAALPVIFHFMLKQRTRIVHFSTLLFFIKADPRLTARRRLRDILILTLRVLLIAALVAAIARPAMQGAGRADADTAVVVIVDNSASMSRLASNGGTMLEVAVSCARRLFGSLGAAREAGLVLTVPDTSVQMPAAISADRAELANTLGKVRETEASGDAAGTVASAVAMLRAGRKGGGIIHVFSDMQRGEWGTTGDAESAGISIVFHRIAAKSENGFNAAIAGVSIPQERTIVGRSYPIDVVVRNTSQVKGEVSIKWVNENGDKGSERMLLLPGENRTSRPMVDAGIEGYRWVRVWLEGDDFAGDNHAAVGLMCQKAVDVVLIGSRNDYGVLPVALAPGTAGQTSGFAVKCVPAAGAVAPETAPALLGVTWDAINEVGGGDGGWLRKYVADGGNLLVVPRIAAREASFKGPTWLGASCGQRKVFSSGRAVDFLDKGSEFWKGTVDVTSGWAEAVRAKAFYTLELTGPWSRLLGSDYANTIFAARKEGKGWVYVLGTPFDGKWNTLPYTGLAVVLAQKMASRGGLDSRSIVLTAGQTLTQAGKSDSQVQAISLIGGSLDWKGRLGDLPAFAMSGVYLVRTDAGSWCASVRSSDREGLEDYITDGRIPAAGALAQTTKTVSADDTFSEYSPVLDRRLGLYIPLVILALTAMLLEGILANPTAARSVEQPDQEIAEDAA